ncbi:MAG: hypothetical protein AAF995_01520 [Planctomycetota bacterium]
MFATLFVLAQQAPEAAALPRAAWLAVAVALVGGVLLWLKGRVAIKGAFALLGLALGGLVGLVLVPLIGVGPIAGFGPGLIGLVIGGVAGLLLALSLLRFVVTVSAALVCAVGGGLLGLALMKAQPMPEPGFDDPAAEIREESQTLRERVGERVQELGQELGQQLGGQVAGEQASDALSDDLGEAADQALVFAQSVASGVRSEWERRPGRARAIVLATTALGFAIGMLAGMIFPDRMTSLITALLGSAMWLGGGAIALRNGMGVSALDRPAAFWLVAWLLVAALGLAIQLKLVGGGKKDKQKTKDDDED